MNALTAFRNDRSGNFGILTALAALPLIVGCGIALDYAAAYSKRSELQSAADAAVLFAASSGEREAGKLKSLAQNVFDAVVTHQFGSTPVVESIELDNENHITMMVSGVVPLSLARIVQPTGVRVSVLSQARMGSDDKLEVALVLDNTYSMSGEKLADLKAASNALLNAFDKADKKREKVRLSITPFAQYVNVGIGNRNKTWLDVPDDSATNTTTCSMKKPLISQTCTTVPTTIIYDGVSIESTKKVCTNQVYGPAEEVCTTSTSTKKWTGCIGSRTAPLNVTDTRPDKPYPGLQNTVCTNAITPLTSDYKVLRAAVTAMTVSTAAAFRETYIPQGILWGWNTINPAEPFDDALDYDDDVKKFIILMTDGSNTVRPQTSNYALHTLKTNVSVADDFVRDVCSNVKSASTKKPVTIFTVAVGVEKGSVTDLALTNCASDPSLAYSVDDSSRLLKTFEAISSRILVARLTK